ncbi:MAG: pyridoxamine 5'-phosphate oxidase family protein [Epsilonproteobacteria bacterium]|nr:pyridoxamine 5'-phosphate oxidase family protein [Campylobacterota bacterium]
MTNAEVTDFLAGFKTCMIASLTPEQKAYASTAPFAREGNTFYILISTVAQHGKNLLSTDHLSLLFAEDENICIQPYARKRITIEASVKEAVRDTSDFDAGIKLLKNRFDAELVDNLAKMGDFHLFALRAQSGSAVMGFGQAYRLDDNLEVVTSISGHHQRK